MARLKLLRHVLITASLLDINAVAIAQKAVSDSSYIRGFPQTVTVRTYLGEKISTFSLADRKLERNIQYRPNNVLALGGGITIRGIGINLSVSLPFHDKKVEQYGKTRRLDIQVHKYGRKLMLDVYLQRYTGFHLNDKSEVTAITGPEEYPYFPTLQALTIGASGLYVFNGDRYSLRAMVNQQAWQLRSAGSALLGASVFSHRFSDDTAVLPRYYRYPGFFDRHQPKEIHYYGLTVNAGYGYTLVFGKSSHLFVAVAADAGAGPGYSSVKDTNADRLSHITYCLTANARIGFGYNSQKWFAGVYVIYHTDFYPLPYTESALGTSQGIGRVVLARRLSTRKRLLAQTPAK